jgi:hypothetical protein
VFHIEDHEIQSAGRKHRADAGSKEFKHYLAQQHVALPDPFPKSGHTASSFAAKAALYLASFRSRQEPTNHQLAEAWVSRQSAIQKLNDT